MGVALEVDRRVELEIPAVTLAGITALELSEGVYVDEIPDSLACLRLNVSNDGAAQQMLTRLQHSAMATLTLQNIVSLHLLPGNLQSLTLVDPFAKEQIDRHDVSNGLRCLTQLRELHIGNFLTTSVVTELLSVSLPLLVTFGFRVHHFTGLLTAPFWDQCPHVFYYSSDIPVVRELRFYNKKPMFLQLPQLVAKLGVSFDRLKVIQVFSFSVGRHATIGLNCNLLTTQHFPHLFGLTCKLWNSEVVLHNLAKEVYTVFKTSSVEY